MSKSDYLSLVSAFNKAISAPPDLQLRINLIEEELNEIRKAAEERNVVELIDGLCDLLYVAYGAADVLNISLDDIVNFESNGDIKVNSHEMSPQRWSLIEDWANFEVKMTKTIFTQYVPYIIKTCWIMAGEKLLIPLRPFFLEVHRTNMEKLEGPTREDGKKLKPPGWLPPRISAMYNRLKIGNSPIHDSFCIHIQKSDVLSHPEGGIFCGICGGMIIMADKKEN